MPVLSPVVRLLVDFFRTTPPLMHIVWAYYALPVIADINGGIAAMNRLMSLPNPPTAIYFTDPLTTVGAMAVIRYAERHGTKRPWLVQLMARRTAKVAAVALASPPARPLGWRE